LDGAPSGLWTSFEILAGQTLRLGPTQTGARCYLCVQGGIEVNLFLGSASTHILSGLGGLEGRALKKGDVLKIGPAMAPFRKRTIAAPALAALAPREILRVTRGPQSAWFPQSSLAAFYDCTYRVTEESNRMGLRLQGTPIDGQVSGHTISEGVSLGAIQVPAGGQPIILFVEQQTAGGYPKIANVISADLPSVGQLRPRDEIRFERVELETARSLLRKQDELLRSGELIFE
jgi:antagonist of KipI